MKEGFILVHLYKVVGIKGGERWYWRITDENLGDFEGRENNRADAMDKVAERLIDLHTDHG